MRIVATDAVPPVAHEAFAALGEIEVRGADAPLADAEVLIVRGAPLDAAALAGTPALQAIARTGAGTDALDVAAATERGIPIVYAPSSGSRPVAEGTVALILAAAKRLRLLGEVVQVNAWERRYDAPGLDLRGARLGVVGLGDIGREVAVLCQGLGMDVVGCDPWVEEPTVELVDLPELVATSDVISLHCRLDDGTRGLISDVLLAQVKPGAILVNLARGPVIESEDVLVRALADGRLSAVALDVFPTEPPNATHPLYRDPRVICTPHSVGLTHGWNAAVFRALAEGVACVLAGEAPPNLLNPEALAVPTVRRAG